MPFCIFGSIRYRNIGRRNAWRQIWQEIHHLVLHLGCSTLCISHALYGTALDNNLCFHGEPHHCIRIFLYCRICHRHYARQGRPHLRCIFRTHVWTRRNRLCFLWLACRQDIHWNHFPSKCIPASAGNDSGISSRHAKHGKVISIHCKKRPAQQPARGCPKHLAYFKLPLNRKELNLQAKEQILNCDLYVRFHRHSSAQCPH